MKNPRMRQAASPFRQNAGRLARLLLLAGLVSLIQACSAYRPQDRPKPFPAGLDKIVVAGFRSALEKGTTPEVIRSPISGDAFTAEPVPEAEPEQMTSRLFDRVKQAERYDLVSPDQARGVFSSLVSSQPALSELEILERIGKAFSADAVLAGYLYRWREREGTDYAVNAPASVAFDLYLIRPDDGTVLWKGQFDMTQKSLSENLLEMDTFLYGGGKWMTADQLAGWGLQRLLKGLDKAPPAEDPEGGS